MPQRHDRILGDDVPAARVQRTLGGEFIVRSTTSCARNQQVTFTRTGDVEGNVAIADPAAQSPRVASPAQGLHGRYQETDTYAGGRTAQVSFDIQSYCLRTGQRCLSSWQNPSGTQTWLFTKDKWVVTHLSQSRGVLRCRSGARAQGKISLEYVLPQPALNPIPLLTGRGRYTVTGGCPYSSDFVSRVERTGD